MNGLDSKSSVLTVVFVINFVQCQLFHELNNLDTIFTNNFTVKIKLNVDINDVEDIADNEGFYLVYHIVSNFYLFNRPDVPAYADRPIDIVIVRGYQKKLEEFIESIVQSSERRLFPRLDPRLIIPDHIFTTQGPNVESEECHTSAIEYHNLLKVTVGVIDAHFDLEHTNYKKNIVHSLCYDFINNRSYGGIIDGCYTPVPPHISHGTQCMGRIASKQKNECDAGVNPYCSLVALQVIRDSNNPPWALDDLTVKNKLFITDARLATALTYKLDDIDIYSCSYGASDNHWFTPLGEVVQDALREGVERGRECKGRIYVFPSGNGHHDNCNADGYSNSIDTITIANVDRHGDLPRNKEVCPCALIAVKGDGYTTTDVCDRCDRGFDGSSASTASGAGLISIILGINNNLSKRDVEHILVRSASQKCLDPSITWHKNGAGLKFNKQIGFGVPEYAKMTELAKNWKQVPERHTCSIKRNGPVRIKTLIVTNRPRKVKVAVHLQCDGCLKTTQSVHYLEHVQLEVHIQCPTMTSLQIYLISPSGTKSPLLTRINFRHKHAKQFTDFNWTFMSANFWGENPEGVWRVKYKMKYFLTKGSSAAITQTLKLHGTSEHPETGSSIPPQCHNDKDNM